MTEFIDVVEHNPITFVKTVSEKFAEGYVVHNTIEGYPHFGTHACFVRLYKGEEPSGVIIPTEFNGMVEHYEPMPFMMLLQSAILAGYKFKEDGQHFIDERNFKSVQLEKVDAKAKTPAKKAPAKKALQAEPTINELKGDE